MQLEIDIEAEVRQPAVAALHLGCLTPGDMVNLVLQRSEVLYDQPRPGRPIKAWSEGDDAPLMQLAQSMGETLARRAAGFIHAEYRAIAPELAALNPKRIADIGCGYGFFDLFAAKDLGADLLLIDLEQNERRHFGFQPEGAAYSSLAKARDLLESNGIPADRIETMNPRDANPLTAKPVDLVVSFLSCGFHYPVDLYLDFLDKVLRPGGVAIFDLRSRTADQQAAKLARFGSLKDLAPHASSRRVMLRKAG
ncbi:MAG: class I SAM-dependent methyltransferase [Rhodobacterales bacterium]|nr:MAG: class I SAM-dependent methyltransferase [Rhodobacterales bacterium]